MIHLAQCRRPNWQPNELKLLWASARKFRFHTFSPMMYNIYTGRGDVPKQRNEDICIFVSSLVRVKELGLKYVFTDRHAYPPMAKYFNDTSQLEQIDWTSLQSRDFKHNPEDPEKHERYQAEALIFNHLPIKALLGVVCYTDAVKTILDDKIMKKGLTLNVHTLPGWYF